MSKVEDARIAAPDERRWLFGLLPRPGEGRRRDAEIMRNNPHLLQAMEVEKKEGQRLAVRGRTIALLVTAILLVIVNPRFEVVYYLFFLGLLILIGYAQLRAARVGQSRVELALILADLVIFTFLTVVPNPLASFEHPTAMQYRFDVFAYLFIFLAAGTLAYSWRTVLSIGVWAAALWLAGAGLVFWLGNPDATMGEAVRAALEPWPRAFEFLDPNSVEFGNRLQEAVVIVIVGAILAIKSRRSAELLVRQAGLATERANLSRYFPPNMVEELASRSEPMGAERSQNVAVLFADIVGFTRFAETTSPHEVIALLREYHGVLEDAVFSHGGTLDKYLGDGIMASFGTPQVTNNDAANALAAAFDMHEGIGKMNARRREAGQEEIRLSVGSLYGPVVLGDIGSARRMEFAMLGDTVNVASRLESTTRQSGCRIVASDNLLRAIADEAERARFEHLLKRCPGRIIRGRVDALDVWEA